MSEEDDEICGEEYRTRDGICTNDPIYSDGKCGYHSEENDDMRGRRPAEKHGLYNSEYYKSLPDTDQNFIDAVADDLLEKSWYEEGDSSMVEKCRQIAIDLHQRRRADGYIAKKGMTQENVVAVHDTHGEVTQTEENTLFITKDRLSRESRLSMKDLGILDEDSAKGSEQTESLLESLSDDME